MAEFVHETEFRGDARGVEAAANRANRAILSINRTATRSFSRRGNAAVGNAAFQFADLAVQLELGVDPARALGQQLPQLLGGFGTLGAVLGAVVAIGLPLATMLARTEGAADALSNAFGELQPLADAIKNTFVALADVSANVINSMVRNLEFLFAIATSVVSLFAFKMVAAFIATGGAAALLSGIIARLPFFALVIVVAELIRRFFVLARATGGVGEAFAALGAVAKEVGGRITLAFRAAGDLSLAALQSLAFGALSVLDQIDKAIIRFVRGGMRGLAAVVEILDKDIARGELTSKIDAVQSSVFGLSDALDSLSANSLEKLRRGTEALAAIRDPLTSVEKIREAVDEMKELEGGLEDFDIKKVLGNLFGDDGAGGSGSTGKKAADNVKSNFEKVRKELQTEQEKTAELYELQQEALKAALDKRLITQQEFEELSLRSHREYNEKMFLINSSLAANMLGQTTSLFNDMARLSKSEGDKLTKIAQVTGAAQALVNTYVAAAQVLADPRLGYFQKFAAVAKTVAAGLGLVRSIKGLSSGGGGGGGGGGGSSGGSSAGGDESSLRYVQFNIVGDNAAFYRAALDTILPNLNEVLADGGRIRVGVA